MLELHGTVAYVDGRTEEFTTGTAALAEWELYALRHGYPIGAQAPPMLSALVIAHAALERDEGFDVWRKTVAGVELDTNGVPPTLEEVSDG